MAKELVPGDSSQTSLPIPPLGVRVDDWEDLPYDFEEEVERRFGPITEVFPPYHNYYDEDTPDFIHWILEDCDWEQGRLRFSGETTEQTAFYNSEYRLLETGSGRVTIRRVQEIDLGSQIRRIIQMVSPEPVVLGTIVTEAVEYYQGDHCLKYTAHQKETETVLVPYQVFLDISTLHAPNEDWTSTGELARVDYDPETGQFQSAIVAERKSLPINPDSPQLVFEIKGKQRGERGWRVIAPRAIDLEEFMKVVRGQREDWWQAYRIFPFHLIQDPPEPVASLTS